MKKLYSLILALILFAVSAPAYALTNWGESDLWQQLKNTFNRTSTTSNSAGQIGGLTATGDLTFQSSLLAVGRIGASSTFASSSTSLVPANLPYSIVFKYVSGANGLDGSPGTTLQDGSFPGQILVLQVVGLMTGGTWKVTPVHPCGYTNITFTAKGQMATLVWDSVLGWVVVSVNATILTQST